MWKIPHPQRRDDQKWDNELYEAFFQSWGNELLVGIGLIGEIAADKEEHRHVNLAYQLKQEGGIKPSNTHGERMSHHHHENSDAFQQVEVFNSLFL